MALSECPMDPSIGKKRSLPLCPPLLKLPETVEELFQALALSVEHDGPGLYSWPWLGWKSCEDARDRLEHVLKHIVGATWRNFNDSDSNDGPMSLNADPGHAFNERVTNGIDAVIELYLQLLQLRNPKAPIPSSPREAIELCFGIKPGDLADAEELEQEHVVVSMYSTSGKSDKSGVYKSGPKNNVLDCRDYGIGMTAEEMPNTILSLNRGNKKYKPWLTGKHGQGASSTCQYSDITIIASRKYGTSEVAFTIVKKRKMGPNERTPTYQYLIIDGKIPTVTVPEEVFRHGTLVRHVGYEGSLYNVHGQNSVFGLLQRSLALTVLPIRVRHHSMFLGSSERVATGIGAGDQRLVRGTVNQLERAWEETINPPAKNRAQKNATITHRAQEVFKLGNYDFGGEDGVQDAGQVVFTWWAADRGVYKSNQEERKDSDVVRNWITPDRPILVTVDGQTHSEESRWHITSTDKRAAGLWAIGKLMVVHIDCDGLSNLAKYNVFTSTREAMKETPLKDMIMEDLVRRLKLDKTLKRQNIELAGGTKKTDEEHERDLTETLKEYCKVANIPFESLVRRVEKWRSEEVDGDEQGPNTDGSKDEPPPIVAVADPTYARWKFKTEPAKLHPGQKYSWIIETDAPLHFWNPKDPSKSLIRVSAGGGIIDRGGGEFKAGRIRYHFQCDENAKVSSVGFIQVQLHKHQGGASVGQPHMLRIEVIAPPVEKPNPPGGEPKPGHNRDSNGSANGPKKPLKVTVTKPDGWEKQEIPIINPIPVTKADNNGSTWASLGWPLDPSKVSFSVRKTEGKIVVYYNAQFPTFIDFIRKLTPRGLDKRFTALFEIKLVMHVIFQLNHGFVDEDETTEEIKKNMRNMLCAAAEDIMHSTTREIDLETRIEKEAV